MKGSNRRQQRAVKVYLTQASVALKIATVLIMAEGQEGRYCVLSMRGANFSSSTRKIPALDASAKYHKKLLLNDCLHTGFNSFNVSRCYNLMILRFYLRLSSIDANEIV